MPADDWVWTVPWPNTEKATIVDHACRNNLTQPISMHLYRERCISHWRGVCPDCGTTVQTGYAYNGKPEDAEYQHTAHNIPYYLAEARKNAASTDVRIHPPECSQPETHWPWECPDLPQRRERITKIVRGTTMTTYRRAPNWTAEFASPPSDKNRKPLSERYKQALKDNA